MHILAYIVLSKNSVKTEFKQGHFTQIFFSDGLTDLRTYITFKIFISITETIYNVNK